MIRTLKDFYTTAVEQGLRTNHQFQIEFGGIPTSDAKIMDDMVIYAMSAQLPGRTIEAQPTPFYGFNFQVPVNTTYEQTWTLEVRCDEQMRIRTVFENWFDSISALKNSTGGSKGKIPTNTYAVVHMLSSKFFNESNPSISRTYRLEGVFPSNIGAMTLNHGDNSIATFSMTLMFQYWYPTSAGNGADRAGDPLK